MENEGLHQFKALRSVLEDKNWKWAEHIAVGEKPRCLVGEMNGV